MMSNRNVLILCGTTLLLGFSAVGGYFYYHKVYVPAHEGEWREEARAQWLQLIASRGGQKEMFQGGLVDGRIEDVQILGKCFKKGEPAANCAAVLATAGQKEVREDGGITYRWVFKVPNPSEIDATLFGFTVQVAGEPPIIDFVGGGYSGD
jgi:hypothetical protein